MNSRRERPMTAPVSVSVPAAVSDQPPVVLPDFREQKPPKWYFEVWLTQRVEILISSTCLIPLQKRVSQNKDMSINTQDSSEVVCTELFRAVFHSNIPKQHTGAEAAKAPVHHTDVITHNVFYHSHRMGFITTVISTFYVYFQCAPHMWHCWFKPNDWTLNMHQTTQSVFMAFYRAREDAWTLKQLCGDTAVALTWSQSFTPDLFLLYMRVSSLTKKYT